MNAIAVGHGIEREFALGHRYRPFDTFGGAEAKRPGQARLARPQRLDHGRRSARRHQGGYGLTVDRQKFRAAVQTGGEGVAVLERLEHEDPVGAGVIGQADAEAGARPVLDQVGLLLDRGDVGEELVLVLRSCRRDKRVDVVLQIGVPRGVDIAIEELGKEIPFVQHVAHECLPARQRAGGTAAAAATARDRPAGRTARATRATAAGGKGYGQRNGYGSACDTHDVRLPKNLQI